MVAQRPRRRGEKAAEVLRCGAGAAWAWHGAAHRHGVCGGHGAAWCSVHTAAWRRGSAARWRAVAAQCDGHGAATVEAQLRGDARGGFERWHSEATVDGDQCQD